MLLKKPKITKPIVDERLFKNEILKQFYTKSSIEFEQIGREMPIGTSTITLMVNGKPKEFDSSLRLQSGAWTKYIYNKKTCNLTGEIRHNGDIIEYYYKDGEEVDKLQKNIKDDENLKDFHLYHSDKKTNINPMNFLKKK